MRFRLVVGAVLLVHSSTVVAQSAGSSRPSPRVGLVAGINLAKLAGKNVEGAENHTGFMGGALVSMPISTTIAFQPELLFTMKGVSASALGITSAAKINYVEVPLLLRLDIPTSAGVKPFVYAGPAVAVKASCSLEFKSQQTTISTGCDETVEGSSSDDVSTISSTDVGGILGGGLAFDVGGRVFTVGARYEIGLVNLASHGDTKNRVLSFVGTLEWPFRR
jgi:hypothetical protein